VYFDQLELMTQLRLTPAASGPNDPRFNEALRH
jgi:hypothetical protein